MKIKSNEDLFNEIYHYAARVTHMAGLIQNDVEITQEEYNEWAKKGVNNLNDIKKWMMSVYKHIQETKE